MAEYDYQLGATYGGMVNIENMTPSIFAPRHDPIVYSRPTDLASLQRRALGYRMTAWHWDFLTLAQYSQLKTFCTGLSASVYIKTKINAGTYQLFTATMLWPEEEPEQNHGKVLDFTIKFVGLQEYTP